MSRPSLRIIYARVPEPLASRTSVNPVIQPGGIAVNMCFTSSTERPWGAPFSILSTRIFMLSDVIDYNVPKVSCAKQRIGEPVPLACYPERGALLRGFGHLFTRSDAPRSGQFYPLVLGSRSSFFPLFNYFNKANHCGCNSQHPND